MHTSVNYSTIVTHIRSNVCKIAAQSNDRKLVKLQFIKNMSIFNWQHCLYTQGLWRAERPVHFQGLFGLSGSCCTNRGVSFEKVGLKNMLLKNFMKIPYFLAKIHFCCHILEYCLIFGIVTPLQVEKFLKVFFNSCFVIIQ